MNSIAIPVLSVQITSSTSSNFASGINIVISGSFAVSIVGPVHGREAIFFVVSVFVQFALVTVRVCIEAMLHALNICGDIGPAVISESRLHDATFNITRLCVINLFDAF